VSTKHYEIIMDVKDGLREKSTVPLSRKGDEKRRKVPFRNLGAEH
jgi:hypothetical protein